MSRRQRVVLAAGGAALLVAVLAGAAVLLLGGGTGGTAAEATPTATPMPTPTPTPTPVESPVNGALLPPDRYAEVSRRLPLAVMMDNHEQARPQSGLDRADLVYEAAVEAGIPRFMAVFWSQEAELILPVRSARTNFVQWAVPLDAVYAHVGAADRPGPANAQGQIREYGLRDLDQFWLGEEAYWRTADRYAPYNVATTTELLWKAAEARGFTGPPEIRPWTFKSDQPAAQPTATRVEISFGPLTPAAYRSSWQYDPATNSYLRFQAGAPHLDGASGAHLAAKTVIVQEAAYHPAGDGTEHMLYDAIGSGEALVFQDGTVTPAVWRKDSVYDRTRFLTTAGTEIPLNRGTIWIIVVPPGYVTYS